MVGILLTGHGNFATGLKTSVKLIAGEQEHFEVVDFLAEYSIDDLKDHLIAAFEKLSDCEAIIVFSDLVGGSPFKTAVELSLEKQINATVLAGTNLGMLLETTLSRGFNDDVNALIDGALETGKNQILKYEFIAHVDDVSDEEGI